MISGLIAPTAPEADRWETTWHYMQGGPGVFKGDLHFYTADGDVRSRVAEIDTAKCPLYLLTGEYDYSATPEITRDLAARIKGAEATIDAGSRPLPHERGPRALPDPSAAGAGADPGGIKGQLETSLLSPLHAVRHSVRAISRLGEATVPAHILFGREMVAFAGFAQRDQAVPHRSDDDCLL